jgi:LmbE family N-acetylglucosaminyl deacetylase
LGANLYHLTYEDQFKAAEGFTGFIAQSRGFLDDLHEIMEEVQPDVVVTFGPDGFSNHIDHRIAGVTATQVVLSKQWEKKPNLFFAATPTSMLGDNWKYQGTDDPYLTVRVSYELEDLMVAKESALCHASQFSPEFVEGWVERNKDRGMVNYLRPFEAPKHSAYDLFNYPNQY